MFTASIDAAHVVEERRPGLLDFIGHEEPMPALCGQFGGTAEQFDRAGVGQGDDRGIDGVVAMVAAVLLVRRRRRPEWRSVPTRRGDRR